MANNKFMDITKWKKVVSKAKQAQKYLDKVRDWDEDDIYYDDDVSVCDAWSWGSDWVNDWFNTVEVNGLYELDGKKIHVIHKESSIEVNDWGFVDKIGSFGFDKGLGISIENGDDRSWSIDKAHWFMVVTIDGIINLILPSRNGNYKPSKSGMSYWNRFSSGDNSEFGKGVVIDEMIEFNDDERVSWLSWEVSCEDNYDYDISWANMRRIA